MTAFTTPEPLGASYGPGARVVSCLSCGVVVRDIPEHLDLHRTDHEARALLVRDLAAARLALAAVREVREKRAKDSP